MCQRVHSSDVYELSSTLGLYDLREGDLCVLGWAKVRRVGQGNISLDLLMCGGGVHSILLLPSVVGCIETIDVCIWRKIVTMSVVVTV